MAAGCRPPCGPAPRTKREVPPAPSAGLELLANNLVDHLAVGFALVLWKDLAHDLPDILRATRDRLADGSADFLRVYSRRKEFLEYLDLGCLVGSQVWTCGILLDRFAPDLNALPQDVDHLVVGGGAAQIDLAVLEIGQDGTKDEGTLFILRFAGRIEGGTQRSVQARLWGHEDHAGRCGRRRLSCASVFRRAFRSVGASGGPTGCRPSRTSS